MHEDPEPQDEAPGWFPAIAGFLGLIVGGGLGAAVGFKGGSESAIQLGLIGAFMGMVLAVVPAVSRDRKDQEAAREPKAPAPQDRTLLTMITSLRRPEAPPLARTPADGLSVRMVANRHADPTGRIDGDLVVRVIKRSGRWTKLQVDGQDEEPVWVETGDLEPIGEPTEAVGGTERHRG